MSRLHSTRPTRRRPPGRSERSAERRPGPASRDDFERLFRELAEARLAYDAMRNARAPLADRAVLRTRLHELRAALAGARHHGAVSQL